MTTAELPKCLLVDDDSSILKLLSMYLEDLGFQPITAHDGDEGIAAFQEHHPSLVVSDIHMPNRNGLLLLQDIKLLNPNIPVILITGYLTCKADMYAAGTKPDAFMEKPFSLEQLRQAISRLQPAIEAAWNSH